MNLRSFGERLRRRELAEIAVQEARERLEGFWRRTSTETTAQDGAGEAIGGSDEL